MYDVTHDSFVCGYFMANNEGCQGYLIDTPRDVHLAWVNTREGVGNPHYKTQIASHVSATTPFYGSKTTVSRDFLSSWFLAGEQDCLVINNDPPPEFINLPGNPYIMYSYGIPYGVNQSDVPIASLSPSAATYNTALGMFYSKMRKAQTEFSGLTFFGELRDTLHMLRRPLQSFRRGLSDYFRRLKKGYGYRMNSRLPFVRDTWLEFQFGMLPLLSDAASAARALAKLRTRIDEFAYIKGFAKELNVLSEETRMEVWNHSALRYEFTHIISEMNSVRIYGQVRAGVANGRAFELESFGFSPFKDFVPTLYELVPFSWLLDYFTNAGGVISAYSGMKSSIAWVSETRRSSRSNTWRGKTSGAQPIQGVIYQEETLRLVPFTIENVRVARTDGLSQSYPALTWQLPGFSVKWINIAAISRAARTASFRLRR